MNPFNVLSHDDTEDISTNNLPRKLAKMKRKYDMKPTEDLKNRIDELEKTLKPLLLNWKNTGKTSTLGDHVTILGCEKVLSLLTSNTDP